MRISTLILVAAGISAVSGAGLVFALQQSAHANHHLGEAIESKYQSYLLADELRQSSDDLTRLARTYVVTGDAQFEAQYNAILDIRNGKKPTPQDYHRIYWDFVAAGNAKPRADGSTQSLQDRMIAAGFTEAEMALLDEAKKNSDGLVALEVEAMNYIKGLDKDGKPIATDDPAKPIKMLHSAQYHTFKSNIMKPVDKFYQLMEERTSSAIDEGQAENKMANLILDISIAVTLATLFGLVALVYFAMLRSMNRLGNDMTAIAGGAIDTQISALGRSDEIGDMATALESFRQSLIEKRAMEGRQAEEAAAVNQRIAAERRNIAMSFNERVAGIFGDLSGSVKDLQGISGQLKHSASATDEQSRRSLVATSEAGSAAQTVASATTELTSSLSEITSRITHVKTRIGAASSVSSEASTNMERLDKMAESIGTVIGLIQDIAEQTNLLALNATIEAARAGESGKGFAVVAAEVKTLANQTARATDDIRTQIEAIQSSTTSSVSSINSINGILTEMQGFVEDLAFSIAQQEEATGEIARAAQVSTHNTDTLTQSVNQVGSMTQDNSRLADKLQDEAQTLNQRASVLQKAIEAFVSETSVKAA
ncbi:methyl-accepting chemotaxis protein [Pannonibacter sp. SL95]|uniref:methyl-accepting chemotaxis protein n=1 Tax=Pannonibacter sp. SL95 TaxID=2995153 RepID=UPI002273F373|nr:methyl-accepting chemotaxis protein [Pannonibacter sp. SL95]MCY1705930.1 methyl-accepting chemotaxis protein [Pannonibacter sp. SL95]